MGKPEPESELRLNRNGTLSVEQAKGLLQGEKRENETLVAPFLLIAIVLFGGPLGLLVKEGVIGLPSLGKLGFVAIIALPLVISLVAYKRRAIEGFLVRFVPGSGSSVFAREIREGRVASMEVRVAWRQDLGSYVLQPVNGSAPPSSIVGLHLPPGPYRVYCLPRSRTLVAAESTVIAGGLWSIGWPGQTPLNHETTTNWANEPLPLAQPPHVGDPAELLRALMAALECDAASLERYRRCRLVSELPPRGVLQRFGLADDGGSEVVAIEGRVSRKREQSRDDEEDGVRWRHILVLGSHELDVDARVLHAVVPDLQYRGYVAARSHRLLALEPLFSLSTGAPRR